MTRSFRICLLILCCSALAMAQPEPLQRWERVIAGDSVDVGTGIAQMTDGTYWMTGYTQSWGAGGLDMYVTKLDSLGNPSWSHTFGSSYHDAALAICATSDNGCVLAGYTQSAAGSDRDIYLVKLNSSGTQQWSRSYYTADKQYANDIQPTFDGGYILAGYAWNTSHRAYLCKVNAQGVQTWTQEIYHNDDEAFAVQQTADSGYIIAGKTVNAQDDGWLIKTDGFGHTRWNHYIGQSGNERFAAVKQCADHGYIVAGYSDSDMSHNRPYLVRTDSTGRVRWSHCYGAASLTGEFHAVAVLPRDNFMAAGELDGQMYLVRIDSMGTLRWDESYDNNGDETAALALRVTRDASYVMAGYTISQTHGWDFYALKTGRDHLSPDAIEPDKMGIPQNFSFAVYPNPFNARTTLSFVLPLSTKVRLELFDVSGRLVRTMADRRYDPGEHRIALDARAFSSGIYFARLNAEGEITTTKMMLLK